MAENENVEKVESAAEAQQTSATPAKKEKAEKKPTKKKPGIFSRIAGWFKDAKAELKKVQWPTWKQTMNNTLIVLAFCLVVGICIFLFDTLATQLFAALNRLFHG